MKDFKKITIEDGDVLRKYLISDNSLCCEMNFGNNILWNLDGRLEYEFVNDDVLIYRMVFDDEVVYCTPDFMHHVKAFIEFIENDAKEHGMKYKITLLNEKMTRKIEEAFPGQYDFSTNRDSSDYIYLVSNLATLPGSKYHKKKNHLNRFKKNYEFQYEQINEKNYDECIAMKDEWLAGRLAFLSEGTQEDEDKAKKTLFIESNAINYAFKNYDALKLVGGLIRVNGKVVAFTMGERLSSDAFVTHFEKALDGYDGLYAAINQQFAEHELGEYTYVNREDDLGIPGLRKAKESYYPEIIYEKYVAVKHIV